MMMKASRVPFDSDALRANIASTAQTVVIPDRYLPLLDAVEGLHGVRTPLTETLGEYFHTYRNTDLVIAIDDEACLSLVRLFNEPAGRAVLLRRGVPAELVEQLDLLGISSIANVLSCIKFAKWYELDKNDVILTVFTDSMELYGSRLRELRQERGEYSQVDAASDFQRYLLGCTTDHMQELGYWDRRHIHNLKYFTWVEQQGKTSEELQAQWYQRGYWTSVQGQVEAIDELIRAFNARTGLLTDLA